MAKNDPNGRTALYRLLAANGRLLYVGIAGNPDSRWGQHSTQQKWRADVADRKIEWFPTREAAAAAEVAAIKAERPLHNIQHAVADAPTLPVPRRNETKVAMVDVDDDWPPAPSQLYDRGTEQRLLGSMMHTRRAIRDATAIMATDDLEWETHRVIYRAVTLLAKDGEPVDPITVASRLVKDGTITQVGAPSYLHVLRNSVESGANAPQYAAIVRTLAVTRRWNEARTKDDRLPFKRSGG